METLLIGVIAGIFGVAYFTYGRKQARFSAMFSGMALCIYPYFFDSVVWLVVKVPAFPALHRADRGKGRFRSRS